MWREYEADDNEDQESNAWYQVVVVLGYGDHFNEGYTCTDDDQENHDYPGRGTKVS